MSTEHESETTKKRILRGPGALLAVSGMVAALLVAAPPASAASHWTKVKSGTTQQISAVDYKGSTIAYATAGGQLGIGSANGSFTTTNAPTYPVFTDIALNPAGTRALAVGTGDDDGELYVYNGSTWVQADLSAATVQHRYSGERCTAEAGLTSAAVENVEFHSVAWANDRTGYVVGSQKNYPDYHRHTGYALKTTDGGLTWTDMQNRGDGSCLVPSNDAYGLFRNVLTTRDPVRVWVMGAGGNWNSLYRSDDGLATLKYTGKRPYGKKLAIDPTNSQRQSASTLGTGYANWTHTTDMWTDYVYTGQNRSHDNTKIPRDLAASPDGWFYLVGQDGLIERTRNGTNAEALPASGALRNTDWQSIAFASAKKGVIAGSGGAMVISTTAGSSGAATQPALDAKPPVKSGGLVKKAKNRFVLQVKGKITPPADINQQKACTGKMQVVVKHQVKKGKFAKVVTKKAKVKKNCKYSKKIVIKGKKAAKIANSKKMKLTVKFPGNKVMAPTKTTYKLPVVR